MKISFVVAVYHNEGAISKTHKNILSVFANELTEYDYEIIFVDDGSGSKSGNFRRDNPVPEKIPSPTTPAKFNSR